MVNDGNNNNDFSKIEESFSNQEKLESMSREGLEKKLSEINNLYSELQNQASKIENPEFKKEIDEKILKLKNFIEIIEKLLEKTSNKKEKSVSSTSTKESNDDTRKLNELINNPQMIEEFEKQINQNFDRIVEEDLIIYKKYIEKTQETEIWKKNREKIENKLIEFKIIEKIDEDKLDKEDLCKYLFFIDKSHNLRSLGDRIGIDNVIYLYNKLNNYQLKNQDKYDDSQQRLLDTIVEELKDLFNIDKLIIKAKTDRLGDGEELFKHFLDNKKSIYYITEKETLEKLIDFAEKNNEKISIKLLNPAFRSSNIILNKNIDLEGEEYLNYIEKRILYEEEVIDGLFKLNIDKTALILKLMKLGISNWKLRELVCKNKIPYISEYVEKYIMDESYKEMSVDEKKFLNSKEYKLGKEKEEKGLSALKELLGEKLFKIENEFGAYNEYANIINNKATKEQKEDIGNYLFRNAKESENSGKFISLTDLSKKGEKDLFIENLITSLIKDGFKGGEFDLIINQNFSYAAARIHSNDNFDFSKLDSGSLSNQLVITSLLLLANKKSTNTERLKLIGSLNITSPDMIMFIVESLTNMMGGNGKTKKEDILLKFLSDVVIYTDKFALNLTKIMVDESIKTKYGNELLNNIREIYKKNGDKTKLLGFINLISSSAEDNKQINFSEEKVENGENNNGLKKYLFTEIDNVSGLSEENKKKIKDIINEKIDEKKTLTKRDILILLSELSELNLDKKLSTQLIQNICNGLSKYKREELKESINDIPHKKLKKEHKDLLELEDEKIKDFSKFENYYLKYFQEKKNEIQKVENKEEKERLIEKIRNDFIDEYFEGINKEEREKILEKLKEFEDIKFFSVLGENPSFVKEWKEKGGKEDLEDFLDKKITYYNPKDDKNNNAKIDNTNNVNKEGLFGDNKYNPENGRYSIIENGKEIEIQFSQKEIEQINNNPENLKRLVNFYEKLNELGLQSLWNVRNEIFIGITNVTNGKFDANDDNFIEEYELKKFLDAILVSLGKVKGGIQNSDSIDLKQYISEYRKYEKISLTGKIAKDADSKNHSQIEAQFINSFMPVGSKGFNIEKFIEAYKTNGKSLEEKNNL